MTPSSRQAAQTTHVGRPARISRQDIARAALAIGLDKATLTAIAKELGVDHSSLYRHIKSRNDILIAAIDLAVQETDWQLDSDHPDGENWRDFAASIAEACWDLFQLHPGIAKAIRNLEVTPPSMICIFSACCQRLEVFGFSAQEATLIMDSIMDMTNDSSIGWQHMQSKGENGTPVSSSLARSWCEMSQKEVALSPYISVMTDIIKGEPKDWWRQKLDLILDGAERLRKR
ncbi:TetR/AcrR family transcriptional regulator [uncultured Cohaesibacter sp.]|uniref:TetR/AcrR family transcriptional regulator n=1 Tax=uncultured Cohaesibacter sp. TaxID=1002546 RepID=UPI00292D64E7|nr:TetR/AcrR family transcriptional regulator [uncultured Cohaesibacter sp.]